MSHQAECRFCGRTVGCTDLELVFLRITGAPICCRRPMALPAIGTGERRAILRQMTFDNIWVDVRRLTPVRGPNIALALTGISPESAGLRLAVAAAPGETLRLSLFRDDASPITTVQGQVGWVRPASGGRYYVGLRFNRSLDENELAELLR